MNAHCQCPSINPFIYHLISLHPPRARAHTQIMQAQFIELGVIDCVGIFFDVIVYCQFLVVFAADPLHCFFSGEYFCLILRLVDESFFFTFDSTTTSSAESLFLLIIMVKIEKLKIISKTEKRQGDCLPQVIIIRK